MYFFIFLKILLVGSILCIAYTLITVCCEALQTIMDLALYKINLQLYIFYIKLLLLSTLLGPYHQSVAFVCRLKFSAGHSDAANYYYIIYN